MISNYLLELGLPDLDVLTVEAAFEWVLANTTLEFDIDDVEKLKALPSCVKLFVVKFCDVMSLPVGITSESIEGMSQSFDTGQKHNLIRQYADDLLGDYVKSDVMLFRARNRWSDG